MMTISYMQSRSPRTSHRLADSSHVNIRPTCCPCTLFDWTADLLLRVRRVLWIVEWSSTHWMHSAGSGAGLIAQSRTWVRSTDRTVRLIDRGERSRHGW